MSELLAGMCMEAAVCGRVVRSYSDLCDQSRFGEYDIKQIEELLQTGMYNRSTLDRLSADLTGGMLILLSKYKRDINRFKQVLTEMEIGDERLFCTGERVVH